MTRLWDEAMERNDADEIRKFTADDWVLVGSNGITSKASFLQWIASGELTHNRMDADELIVKMFGSTGIVVGKGTSAGNYKGESFRLYEWSTSVFIKKEGNWLCVLTMLTPATK